MSDLYLSDPWHKMGPTPLIQISPGIFCKLETVNPTGSIKDRLVKYIVEDALCKKAITGETILIEATSGNTGISLSAIGASLGLPVKIIMPKNMSNERKQMILAFGAEIIEVDDNNFIQAIDVRNQMIDTDKNYWSPMQFENALNIECHRSTTAQEILSQLPKSGSLSAFISGAGTGGTIMGVRKALVEKGLSTHVCLVHPAEDDGEHGIQGINDGADFLVNHDLLDMKIPVRTVDAKFRAQKFAHEMGVLVGISSGANIWAAEKYRQTIKPSGSIVTILCDRGERYLST